jgi:hypothetical protein
LRQHRVARGCEQRHPGQHKILAKVQREFMFVSSRMSDRVCHPEPRVFCLAKDAYRRKTLFPCRLKPSLALQPLLRYAS